MYQFLGQFSLKICYKAFTVFPENSSSSSSSFFTVFLLHMWAFK